MTKRNHQNLIIYVSDSGKVKHIKEASRFQKKNLLLYIVRAFTLNYSPETLKHTAINANNPSAPQKTPNTIMTDMVAISTVPTST